MKRIVLVLLFAWFVFGGSSSTGQPLREANRPVGATRVAVVNVGHIFHHYERAIRAKAEIDDLLRGPKRDAQKLIQEAKAWESAIAGNDFTAGSKEELEEKITQTKRKLEYMDKQMKKVVGKRQEENLVILWNEVRDGIRLYAEQHKLEIVLGYGDPADRRDLDLFPNVNRKMQAMDLGGSPIATWA